MGKVYNSIYQFVKDIKTDYPKLSDYEALTIAVQMQRNEILKAGFSVHSNDEHPPSLEAIAIQLGFEPRHGAGTILEALRDKE